MYKSLLIFFVAKLLSLAFVAPEVDFVCHSRSEYEHPCIFFTSFKKRKKKKKSHKAMYFCFLSFCEIYFLSCGHDQHQGRSLKIRWCFVWWRTKVEGSVRVHQHGITIFCLCEFERT
ncbi:hypothetical protein PRUPE_5G060500 [Prunus persica]|uniref:Secreted protein n=1 Tax=Prunus persica TaxID=3760 RepID=A0A251P4C9_PRUPE|nr:hypothetical protein PRUPE_5G060500 [Prunus persica]